MFMTGMEITCCCVCLRFAQMMLGSAATPHNMMMIIRPYVLHSGINH